MIKVRQDRSAGSDSAGDPEHFRAIRKDQPLGEACARENGPSSDPSRQSVQRVIAPKHMGRMSSEGFDLALKMLEAEARRRACRSQFAHEVIESGFEINSTTTFSIGAVAAREI